jgi:hypothetical protein
MGQQVVITADTPAEGYVFDEWELTEGEGTISNENNPETTFTMAAGNATVTATYKDAPLNPEEPNDPAPGGDELGSGDNAGDGEDAGNGDDAGNGTASVTTSTGEKITSTITIQVSAPVSAAIFSQKSEVNAAAGLTEEEVASGHYVEVKITSSSIEGVSEEVIENAVNAIGAQIALTLDIEVNKIAGNGAPVSNINLLEQAISIVLSAPVGFDPNLFDFAIVRLHDGQTDILPDMDSDPNTITFGTDRFSTYTVIYGPKGSFDAYKTAISNSPKTGDSYPYAIPITALLVACCCMGAMVASRKRRQSS